MFGISQWIMYGSFALAAVVCVGVVARALWVPADVRRRCCCGGCGYALTDVASGRCPECGGALNKVGVTTPAMAVRLRGSLGWALLAWTTLFALVVGPVWSMVEMAAAMSLAMAPMTTMVTASGTSASMGPGKTQVNEQITLAPRPAGDAGVAGDFRIDGSINAVFDGAGVDSSQVTLRLRINGAASDAALDLDTTRGTYELWGANKSTLAGSGPLDKLDAGAVKKWFDAAGIETTSAEGAVSARDALKIAKMCINDPAGLDAAFNGPGSDDPGGLMVRSRSSSGGLGGMSVSMPAMTTGMPVMPSPWTPAVIAGAVIGLLIYVVGVVGITWRNRRLLA